MTREEAQAFLFREARLLDERRLDDWLALFTADSRYWIPSGAGADPYAETQLVFDDLPQLQDRVWQAQHPRRHSQSPPSKTVHLISNVEVEPGGADEARLFASFVVFEVRSTQSARDEQRSFAGRYEHLLRCVNGEWRIAMKKVWLINRDLPIHNLTFFL